MKTEGTTAVASCSVTTAMLYGLMFPYIATMPKRKLEILISIQPRLRSSKRFWKNLTTVGEHCQTRKKTEKKVGVITFYAAQERRIRQQIDLGSFPNLQIEIGTVDRFQGREYPIVVVSMVQNNTDGNVGHAKVPERVNVALSRARSC